MTVRLWVNYSQVPAYIGDIMGAVQPDNRVFAMGAVTMAAQAQAGYIYGAYFFPTEDATKILLGFGVVTVCSGSCTVVHFW
ncbi:hypothetical protein B0T25DRAFT_550914 [Lasiosphaeria hispida]|uniref:Uncharacterized protein n=1 Tax=Lasiosphaeria hispida TaxID=260671 RepID=A0AAJ0MA98_9PEZI|nr:hypothetical protein B0T25DRAFT_550914 [Lasiosphaeria hispida]